jgi:hypothetical protein
MRRLQMEKTLLIAVMVLTLLASASAQTSIDNMFCGNRNSLPCHEYVFGCSSDCESSIVVQGAGGNSLLSFEAPIERTMCGFCKGQWFSIKSSLSEGEGQLNALRDWGSFSCDWLAHFGFCYDALNDWFDRELGESWTAITNQIALPVVVNKLSSASPESMPCVDFKRSADKALFTDAAWAASLQLMDDEAARAELASKLDWFAASQTNNNPAELGSVCGAETCDSAGNCIPFDGSIPEASCSPSGECGQSKVFVKRCTMDAGVIPVCKMMDQVAPQENEVGRQQWIINDCSPLSYPGGFCVKCEDTPLPMSEIYIERDNVYVLDLDSIFEQPGVSILDGQNYPTRVGIQNFPCEGGCYDAGTYSIYDKMDLSGRPFPRRQYYFEGRDSSAATCCGAVIGAGVTSGEPIDRYNARIGNFYEGSYTKLFSVIPVTLPACAGGAPPASSSSRAFVQDCPAMTVYEGESSTMNVYCQLGNSKIYNYQGIYNQFYKRQDGSYVSGVDSNNNYLDPNSYDDATKGDILRELTKYSYERTASLTKDACEGLSSVHQAINPSWVCGEGYGAATGDPDYQGDGGMEEEQSDSNDMTQEPSGTPDGEDNNPPAKNPSICPTVYTEDFEAGALHARYSKRSEYTDYIRLESLGEELKVIVREETPYEVAYINSLSLVEVDEDQYLDAEGNVHKLADPEKVVCSLGSCTDALTTIDGSTASDKEMVLDLPKEGPSKLFFVAELNEKPIEIQERFGKLAAGSGWVYDIMDNLGSMVDRAVFDVAGLKFSVLNDGEWTELPELTGIYMDGRMHVVSLPPAEKVKMTSREGYYRFDYAAAVYDDMAYEASREYSPGAGSLDKIDSEYRVLHHGDSIDLDLGKRIEGKAYYLKMTGYYHPGKDRPEKDADVGILLRMLLDSDFAAAYLGDN